MIEKVLEKKLKVFTALVSLIFIILLSRLAYVQLVQTQEYKTLSEQNRIRLIPTSAKRGEILDRSGKVILAKDRPVYTVSISYLGIKDEEQEAVINKLASILKVNPEEIQKTIKETKVKKYEPIKIAQDVPLDVVAKIEENRLNGVEINVEPMRNYVFKDFMPHILGYVREITQAQFEKHKDEGYALGDRYGQAGLENYYENELKGKDGYMLVEVDKSQRPAPRPPLDIKDPTPGNNLILNIDYNVQKVAEDSLTRIMTKLQGENYPMAKAGAAVMIDVNTGKVIAMASKPGYDPNIFNGKITPEQSAALFGGSKEENPFPAFNNRAMMGYAPGSTFKMATSAAVLESKKATRYDTYFDSGSVYLFGRTYKCWQPSGHGVVNLVKAIQTSCNVYFYQMGLRAGVDNLVKYAGQLGLGKKTGIDLPNESAGRLPSPEWKKSLNEASLNKKYEKKYKDIEDKYAKLIEQAATEKEKKQLTREKNQQMNQAKAMYKIDYNWQVNWQPYETIIMSIGQGDNFYTPLQLANYIATLANGGSRYQPFIVDKIVDYKGNVVKQNEKKLVQKVEISPNNLQAIKEGMRAVTSPGGTAYGIFKDFPVTVAGKTGTAQTGKDKWGNEKPTHGLFVAFAPYDKPQVAVAAIIENGGHGGSSAGMVVRDMLAAYFKIDHTQLQQNVSSLE